MATDDDKLTARLAPARDRTSRILAMASPDLMRFNERVYDAIQAALSLADGWQRQALDHAGGLDPSLSDYEAAALSGCARSLREAITAALAGSHE